MHWFFKVTILVIAAISFLIFIAFIRPRMLSQLHISNSERFGIIWQNEVWSGTIKVTGDIFAMPGSKVEVLPGSQILVAKDSDKSNFDFIPVHHQSGINTNEAAISGVLPGEPFLDEKQKISLRFGKFYARGTKEQPIIIASDTTFRSPYDFNIFSFRMGILKDAQASNFRRMEIGSLVRVSDTTFTDIGECAVCISSGSPDIINNVFIRSLRDHIYIKKASPKIVNNAFLPAQGSGILIDPRRLGNPQILNNEFQLPNRSAIKYISGGEKEGGIISNNLFAAGNIEIPCDSKVKIEKNHIKSGITFQKSGNCVGEFKIGGNFWEIGDQGRILNERIIGKEPDFKIKFEEILPEPPEGVGRVTNP